MSFPLRFFQACKLHYAKQSKKEDICKSIYGRLPNTEDDCIGYHRGKYLSVMQKKEKFVMPINLFYMLEGKR